ncbi:hypothetical protein [Rhizobium laguerreae]|uniref:hypothetical protein n=1 Tax=Rhizobium laguerreae TaxID=1076926 RepID=UPI001C90525D|nr:hypothetical protein [Rhizobium laguerreae]MBY3342737.1 hypothetical protein [Rhizobium laguerreae]MBY3349772.1 hypothetical protein [Rhizobium laguerreae]MBY3370875.1 hypothetical protein [Rhizobium laguerreae]MBY3426115.1 hypothetical protein [Rhizobium laguerreae]MBY3434333.1 hypothetical protein [Rhizobium laguerreae]
MDRINGAGTTDIGGGRRGFRDENLGAGVEGTEVTALWANMIQEEIMKVCTEAGLAPSEADWTQLYQAINILLDALFADVQAAFPYATTPEAIAGVLLNKIINPKTLADVLAVKLAAGPLDAAVATYLNVYPTILTVDNKAVITPSAGQVVVTPFKWIWRQFKTVDLADLNLAARTFATTASKTYHLRLSYNVVTGVQTLSLKDLSSAGYNPSALAEGNVAFDGGYDDMLIARVTTDAGNVPTVKALKNASRLTAIAQRTTSVTNANPAIGWVYDPITVDWSRQPAINLDTTNSNISSEADNLQGIIATTRTRYGFNYLISGTSPSYYITCPYLIGISA